MQWNLFRHFSSLAIWSVVFQVLLHSIVAPRGITCSWIAATHRILQHVASPGEYEKNIF